ncbi:Fe-S cluster assembly protein SufD [Caulobacter sp. S45]|uniref:Fe-S cluster assembly protein SufD n=1 Tax=Caulobacter sp. S45 TaxID=1641861 RepID=UPI001576423E|nr:Fe-S cluster assembly protein SufD [Caulobacter sp. S45]
MSAPFRIDLRDVSTFPTRRDEAWRWSDLRRALGGEPVVAAAFEIEPPGEGGPFASIAADETVFANGRLADGETLARLTLADKPHRLRFVTSAEEGGWQAGADVVVPAGVSATLLETYEGRGAYVASAILRFSLGADASVERIVLLEEPAAAVSISASAVSLGAGAHFAQTVVATGAKLQRHETHVVHPGGGASVRMDGLYLLADTRHADLTTVVVHEGGGETSQMCKGVATDRARAVFQGQIVVKPGADGTDARMRHDALLLSDTAEVDAKPELEIYADDVSCAHGNTVGALDEEALFYIASRGVPEAEAKALLMQGFIGEVVERITHEGAREVVRAFAAERLEALT